MNYMIRMIILISVQVLTLFTPSTHASPQTNIILILVDDLGWMDLSCQGSSYYETPNLDRLAAQGMRFTNAYAASAVCSPTRAAVQTGRYPARLGVTDWIRSRFQGGAIPADKESPAGFTGGRRNFLVPKNQLEEQMCSLSLELLQHSSRTLLIEMFLSGFYSLRTADLLRYRQTAF